MNEKFLILLLFGLWLLFMPLDRGMGKEQFIITTTDGSQIMVLDYDFSGDRVEYTTTEGLSGFIPRQDFLSISNIGTGAPPPPPADQGSTYETERRQVFFIWVVAAVLMVLCYLLFFFVVIRKRKRGPDRHEIYPGRRQREPRTQGHLAFYYRGFLGRQCEQVIEVRDAYEEEGTLYIEGIRTSDGRRKTFRADRVEGLATDRSSGRQAPLDRFFHPITDD